MFRKSEYKDFSSKYFFLISNKSANLDALAGTKYFSVLDIKSGYHQIELVEEHKERTVFTVVPLGFLRVQTNSDWFGKCTCDISKTRGRMSGGLAFLNLPCVPGLYHHVF